MKLLYTGDKEEMVFTLPENPVTNPRQSPRPTGKTVDQAKDEVERLKIINHPSYSKTKTVVLRQGINEFDNDEHAEYVYKLLGNPDDGGYREVGYNKFEAVKNNQVIFEVDEDGNPIQGPLWNKYRAKAKGTTTQTFSKPAVVNE